MNLQSWFTWDRIERILVLLKPKYYNLITYVIVGTGCSLLTKPIWLELLNFGLSIVDTSVEGISIEIIGKWDPAMGLLAIVMALYWHTRNRLIDLQMFTHSEPVYLGVSEESFQTFRGLCIAVYPILKDNQYIFETVGPNSNALESKKIRGDLTMWYKYRSETIVPNNQKIKDILQGNTKLFNPEIRNLTNKVILHIDAFEEHLNNPAFDYSEFTFPKEFQDLVETTCYEYSANSAVLKGQIKWLNKKLLKINPEKWYVIGSAIYILEKANDLDIVILLNEDFTEEKLKLIEILKMDFKLKYKYRLHTTLFDPSESVNFDQFMAQNPRKLKGHG